MAFCVSLVGNVSSQSGMVTVELVKGIKASIPTDFVLMEEGTMADKYPSYKKPLVMYTNADISIDFGVNTAASKWEKQDYDLLLRFYKSTVEQIFSKVEWLRAPEVVKSHGRPYVWLEFKGQVWEENSTVGVKNKVLETYHFLSYTYHKDQILIFNYASRQVAKLAQLRVDALNIHSSVQISRAFRPEQYQPIRRARKQPTGEDGVLYKKMREGK